MDKSIFFEIHQGLPREGPGTNESTRKAFSFMKDDLPAAPLILDIGCGPGMQTIELARISKGEITALDTHPSFLTELDRRSELAGLKKRIHPVKGSMFSLPFEKNRFDLIWSEGAIYIIGFRRGLAEWGRLVKPNGYIVVSELTWLEPERPEEIDSYWSVHYPGMRSVAENLEIIRQTGYQPIEHFVLPETGWWEDYYLPLERRIAHLWQRHRDSPHALAQLEEAKKEIDLYRNYSRYYGYVFYILQVNDRQSES